MPILSIPLADSTPEQRSAFARNFLNLPIEEGESDDAILARIQAAQPNATLIFVNEPDTPEDIAAIETAEVELRPEEATGRLIAGLGEGDPRATIFIPVADTEDGSGSRDVLVGVNGRAWQLKRGFDLDVPWRVVEALKNAKATIVRHSTEEGKEGDVLIHEADRFPVQLKRGPSQAQIEEWLERTGEFCA